MWSIFRNLKKFISPDNSKKDSPQKKSENSNLITFMDLGFRGDYSESSNNQFLIGWLDGNIDTGIVGYRKTGNGKFIIIKNGKIILQGDAERPNDCKIANNGNFIINDWLFSDEHDSIFYAYDNSGSKLVSQYFSANLNYSLISDDGRFAVSSLCNSNSDDSGLIAIFDLQKGTLIAKIYPEDDLGLLSSISSIDKTITFDYNDLGKFRYDFDGIFIDKEKLHDALIENGSVFHLLEKVKNTKKIDDYAAKKIIILINNALDKGVDKYPKAHKAQVYRWIGEIYEKLKNIDEAIKNYEIALMIDPKVGIKRRLNLLKKRINEIMSPDI